MATIPQKFPEQPEAAIASYDYTDIAEGTGIIVFYGGITESTIEQGTTATSNFILSKKQFLSKTSFEVETTSQNLASTGQTFVLVTNSEKNFDLSVFNLPKIIEGTAFIQHCFAVKSSADNVPGVYGKIKYSFVKYSAGETTIISVFTNLINNTVTSYVKRLISTQATLPITHFKKGDILRLKIELYAAKNSADAGDRTATFCVPYDPLNRDSTNFTPSTTNTEITQLIVNVPFKIDL